MNAAKKKHQSDGHGYLRERGENDAAEELLARAENMGTPLKLAGFNSLKLSPAQLARGKKR